MFRVEDKKELSVCVCVCVCVCVLAAPRPDMAMKQIQDPRGFDRHAALGA